MYVTGKGSRLADALNGREFLLALIIDHAVAVDVSRIELLHELVDCDSAVAVVVEGTKLRNHKGWSVELSRPVACGKIEGRYRRRSRLCRRACRPDSGTGWRRRR